MPAPKPRPSTVYLDPRLAKAGKVRAALTDKSFSDLVNEALASYLGEDAQDIKAFRERAKEPDLAFEDVLDGLKRDGLV